MAILSNTDLRNGVVYTDNGDTFIVLKYEHNKQGRGSATVKVKVKNLKTGAITIKSYKAGDKVESAEITRENAQYLYSDSEYGYFMNDETFEQYSIPLSFIEELVCFLKESEKVVVQKLEDNPIMIEIPKKVELEVKYAEPAVAGNTSSGAMKVATLETGLTINVPLFVKTGDIVIVNTELKEYVGRK
jgi:elongation factor P